ncbi:MAG: JDVT-CTERM domain-containing protein, partial [Betaproteobacteria bacterium]
LAYDLTPDMDAANPEKTAVPTANYNLYFTRSTKSGEAGSWSPARNLSRVDSPALTVVEPRMVPTPGTIVNPLTGTPDAGDTQNPSVLYACYATETNTLVGQAGRVYVSRSFDQGATFEPFVPVSASTSGQSESQLRPSPDGSSAVVLWMGEQTPGDPATKDAMFATGVPFELPDLALSPGSATLSKNSTLTLGLNVFNRGTGSASKVVLSGAVPNGLVPVNATDASACTVSGLEFTCTIPTIAAGKRGAVALTVTGATEGEHLISMRVTGEEPDANLTDNVGTLTVSVTPELSANPPVPIQPPPSQPPPSQPPPSQPPPSQPPAPTPPPATSPAVPTATADSGGGCTVARPGAPFDPVLLLMAGLGLLGVQRRVHRGAGS